MKLNLETATFQFNGKAGVTYTARIIILKSGRCYWNLHKDGDHLGNYEEQRTEQYVNQTRAKQMIQEAEKALKINSGNGK